MAFDTLSYARKLRQAGVPEAQAEAMADATRELAFSDFSTKADFAELKTDFTELRADFTVLKNDFAILKNELVALEQRMTAAMDTLSLRLTVRLGGLIAIGVAVLAAIIKL